MPALLHTIIPVSLLLLLSEGLGLPACHPTAGEQLKSIRLIVHYPVVIKNKDSSYCFANHDSISIHFYRDIVLYRLPPAYQAETDKPIPGSETYFIFRKPDSLGSWVNGLEPGIKGMLLPVDSFLRNRCFYGADFNIRYFLPDWALHTISHDHDLSVEKYYLNRIHTDEEPDSLYLYFADQLRDIDYSLSPGMDSSRNLKLVTARIVYNGQTMSPARNRLPKRELFFSIQKEEPLNREQVLSFMKRYE